MTSGMTGNKKTPSLRGGRVFDCVKRVPTSAPLAGTSLAFSAAALLLSLTATPALAQTGTAGDDVFVFDAANPPVSNVNTLAGNDSITIDEGITTSFQIDAGDDDDTLTFLSGTTNSIILFGAGNDTVILFDGANFPGGINGGVEPPGGGDTLIFRTAVSQTLDGNFLQGFEQLIKEDAGTLTNTGAFPLLFTNGVQINGGTLRVGLLVGGPTLDMADDTTLIVDGGFSALAPGATTVLAGSSGVNRITVTDANAFPTQNGLYAAGDLGDGADLLTTAGIINTAAGTLSLGLGDDVFTINAGADVTGIISGGAGNDQINADIAAAGTGTVDRMTDFETLTKTGAGTLVVEGAGASNIGTVNVNAGTLSVAAGGSITDVSSATVSAGATLDLTGGFVFTPGNDTFAIAGTLASANNIDMLAGDDTLTLQGAADISGFSGNFDGGAHAGGDTFNFNGWTGTLPGARLQNWETVSLTSSTVGFGPSLTAGVGAGMGLIVGAGSTASGDTIFALTGDLTTLSGGTFTNHGGGSGSVTVSGDVTNDGALSMQDGSVGDTITVGGDYGGAGTLAVDVDFTADTADTVTINGGVVSGSTTISVADVSTGAESGNDILLVDVIGSTANGDFQLAGGPLTIGALMYELNLVGSQWFLQQLMFLPQNALYEVYPRNLQALNTMPTHRQRVQDRTWLAGGQAPLRDAGAWVRASGGLNDLDPRFSTTEQDSGTSDIDYDIKTATFEAGLDVLLGDWGNGRLVGGVRGSYGVASLSGSSPSVSGDIDTGALGVGSSLTWYDASGFYIDAQLQHAFFKSDLSTNTGTLISDNDGTGYAASLEVGKAISLGDACSVTPELQYVYYQVDFDGFTAESGESVSLDDGVTSELRIGGALEYHPAASEHGSNRLFVTVSAIHRFDGTTVVNSASSSLTNEAHPWRGEVGVGGSHEWQGPNGQRFAIYGEVSVGTEFGSSWSSGGALNGRVGFKVEF